MNAYSTRGLAILAGGLAFVGSANAIDLIVNGSFEDPVGVGWVGYFKTYNYSAAYFTGPPIPESENPGSVYSWRHGVSEGSYDSPCIQTVDLTMAASAEDIDAGYGQYTFSAWLASYGQPSSNPEQPYLTVKFLDETGANQVGGTVVFDRVTSAFFTTFADGVTTFDSDTHQHSWAKYVRTSSIPTGARSATVGITRSPNAGVSGTPDTYTDLVKFDVEVAETRPSLDSSAPTGVNAPGKPTIRIGLRDGAIAVDPDKIFFTFDGATTAAAISKDGQLTSLTFDPGILAPGSAHTYGVVYTDLGTPPLSQTNAFSFKVADYIALPAGYAQPPGSANTPGFTYRSVLAPAGTPMLATTVARTRAQLDLTLLDPNTGQPYPNAATPGPNLDGSYNVDTVINFEQSGLSAGNFGGDLVFPGIEAGDHDSFSTEALFYLDLPAAGYYRFGVNSDDGFEFSAGTLPQDALSPQTVLGVYDAGRGPADSLFDFLAPVAGTYSFRLIYEEGAGGASCELFSVDLETGARILVNDTANPKAIPAYRVLSGAAPPYVRAVQPATGATDIPVESLIRVDLWDRATAVADGTIRLQLNGVTVTPEISKNGIITTVSFQPPDPLAYLANNTVELVYGDGTVLMTNHWSFLTRAAAQAPGITGQWDFKLGDLSATIGLPLEYLGGTNGPTVSATRFATTTALGLPDINGVPAAVMHFSGAANNTLGYVMKHGAVPNGSPTATKVNQWTLIMDTLIQTAGWFSFVQIDALDNSNDGELFMNSAGGIGITGSYQGTAAFGEWHRIAFAVDAANVISKFIDGVKVADQTSWDGKGLDARHAMFSSAILLGDENGDSQPCALSSVQFRNYKMRDGEIAALGGPSPEGIPTVGGQWDFEDVSSLSAGLTATIGADMVMLPETELSTVLDTVPFGDLTANTLHFLAVDPAYGYQIVPGGVPNPGSSKINRYSLVMDVMYPVGSQGAWRALWQTRTNNDGDASLFINTTGGVGISGNYVGKIEAETWYRLGFTFDLTTRTLKRYINGTMAGAMTLGEGVDGRWAVDATALVFTDNDGDNAEGYCNSLQFRPVALTDEEMALLGGPSAAGIPLALPVPFRITSVTRSGSDLVIKWSGGTPPFQVKFKPDLKSATWDDSGPTTDTRSATVPLGAGAGFLRVMGQ